MSNERPSSFGDDWGEAGTNGASNLLHFAQNAAVFEEVGRRFPIRRTPTCGGRLTVPEREDHLRSGVFWRSTDRLKRVATDPDGYLPTRFGQG